MDEQGRTRQVIAGGAGILVGRV
ncbi:protein of unknown function [Xenorhabdus doucetiae]|uniref:Uncharacterized protein n=1 Tax=Xenorhabdus doucetiae TaxID=351671 RepID=A0A068QU66_9GAMM|nr:protein of unknown function [Xenorhabdus doucetiae]CDG19117.1 protein of unknown function [Xenorhabdus doucetiae]